MNRATCVVLVVWAAIWLVTPPAWAQQAEPAAAADAGGGADDAAEPQPAEPEPIVPAFDFEDEEALGYWFALDGEAQLGLTRDKDDVAHGQAALEIVYTPRAGVFCLFGAKNLQPLDFQSFRCAIKTDLQTPTVFSVEEQDGSKYHAFACTPQDQWKEIAFDVSEFMLADDSTDENDQLDTEQVVSLTVADLSNLEGESGRALGHKFGEQHLYLDDVELSAEPGRKRSAVRDGARRVEGFELPLICGLPLGSVKLMLQPGAPPTKGRSSLRITYRLGGHRWAGIVTGIGHVDLAGVTHFSCHVQSSHEGQAVAVLEERDGSKYEHALALNGRGEWQQVSFPLTEFERDPKTEDENNQLDSAQIRVLIVVIDTFNATVGDDGEATLDLDDLTLSAEG